MTPSGTRAGICDASALRVAHVVGKMLGGGVEAVVMNYYRHIDRDRIQFDFIVDRDSKLVPKREIEDLGGRVLEVPPYQKLPAYIKALGDLFSRERWQVVHSHINALSVFPLGAAKRAGVPVRIAHSHSTSGKGEWAKNALKALLRTQANRYPTHRFACSEYAGTWLFGNGADFAVVRNAFEVGDFAFDNTVRTCVRNELGLARSQRVIGHVGRFMIQKNHAFLLEVFAELAERCSDAVLVLVGEGALRPLIESRAIECGISERVHFLGQRGDVKRLYQAFDVFVLPSLYEGLGLVGVEAQASGLPCVFSNAIPREVSLTPNCRFLEIGKTDVSLWVDALEEAIDAPRPVVDASLFEPYNIDQAARLLEKLYLDACRSEAAPLEKRTGEYQGGWRNA